MKGDARTLEVDMKQGTKSSRPKAPALYLGLITTGSRVDLASRQGQERLARALLSIPTHTPSSEQSSTGTQVSK